jgi:hypothetical protein
MRSPNAQRITPIMPPLTEEEIEFNSRDYNQTVFVGNSCENVVASYLLNNGINIAIPSVDQGIDFLVHEEDNNWLRAQVKKVVFTMHKDYGYEKRNGSVLKRPRFAFSFQGGGGDKRQHTSDEIDIFYHVLQTNLRTLIFKIPSDIIPLRKCGSFIQGKYPVLDNENWIRKKADFDIRKMLVHAQYDQKLIKLYSDFFLKEDPVTMDQFL